MVSRGHCLKSGPHTATTKRVGGFACRRNLPEGFPVQILPIRADYFLRGQVNALLPDDTAARLNRYIDQHWEVVRLSDPDIYGHDCEWGLHTPSDIKVAVARTDPAVLLEWMTLPPKETSAKNRKSSISRNSGRRLVVIAGHCIRRK